MKGRLVATSGRRVALVVTTATPREMFLLMTEKDLPMKIRSDGWQVDLYPSRAQGETAAQECGIELEENKDAA
jgi:hypothetical protein